MLQTSDESTKKGQHGVTHIMAPPSISQCRARLLAQISCCLLFDRVQLPLACSQSIALSCTARAMTTARLITILVLIIIQVLNTQSSKRIALPLSLSLSLLPSVFASGLPFFHVAFVLGCALAFGLCFRLQVPF